MRRVARVLAVGTLVVSAIGLSSATSTPVAAYGSGVFGVHSARAGVIGVGSSLTRFACAVTENGGVKCWGDNFFGHLGQGDTVSRGDDPNEMGNNLKSIDLGVGRRAKYLSVGGTQTCALLDNDRVKCWGQNSAGQLGYGNIDLRGDQTSDMGDNLPFVDLGSGRTVTALSSGTSHICTILDNGRVKCWGFNSGGALGYGDTVARGDGSNEMGDNLPYVDLGTGRTAVAVSAGFLHSCAILDNGRGTCWGSNTNGELGYGDTVARGDGSTEMGDNLPYVDLGTGRTAVAVTAGELDTCAILDNGAVKCWGSNSSGQLGLGDTNDRGDGAGEMATLPTVDLGTGRTAVQVSLGPGQTCAVLDNGTAKCWGKGSYGQLGYDSTNVRGDASGEMGNTLPTINLGAGRTARSISTGFEATCATLDDQTVKCWGRNGAGELGNGTKEGGVFGDAAQGDNAGEMAALPVVDLGSTYDIVAIDAFDRTRCGLFASGRVKCWGNNNWGQLGLGDVASRGDGPGEMGDSLPFVDLGTGRTAKSIAVGERHACALLDNGTVKCWGYGLYGQLGLGDNNDRSDGPGEMGDNLPAVSLGTGRTAVAISAGRYHTCAVLDDRSVKCWGRNSSGQLGLGDISNRGDAAGEMGDSLPVVSLGANAVAVTTGDIHTCALLDNGAVKCWGSNDYGQLGLGDANARGDGAGEMGANLPVVSLNGSAIAVEAGVESTCAILANGSLKCWGRNNLGQLGYGNVLPVGDGPNEMGANLPAVDLGAGRTARLVRSDSYRNCAVLDDYSVKCWGNGNTGGLGQGDTLARGDDHGEMAALLPVNLGANQRAIALANGTGVCAVLSSGLVKCWGSALSGQLGDGQSALHRGDIAGEMGDSLPYVELDATKKVLAPTGRPLAPTALAAAPGTTNAALSWSAPTNNGGAPIIGYRIDRSADGVTWTTVTSSTGTTATSALVSSLSPGTAYQFRVYALNANGTGLPSISASATTISEPNSTVAGFMTLTPTRIVNTRPTGKIGNLTGTADPMTFNVHGKGGLPNSGIAAVLLNVTVVDPEVGDEGGYLTVYPCASGRPDASNLNFVSRQIIPNTVIAPVDPSGNICFHSYGKTHVLADVSG
ncbi:MAG: fibronectin type III domain-containing protein, partial [Ilumatobacteraceae bacterium]